MARHRAVLRRSVRGGASSSWLTRSGSATAPASTATGSRRCARCSRAGRSDVLTGDYLAELTMLILGRDQLKDPSLGYARTFVTPARGLPRPGARAGREDRLQRRRPQPRRPRRPHPRGRARGSASTPAVAYVDGDDVRSVPSDSRRRADRQRVPRRVRHRGRARRRRRRRGHRPGHRRLAGGRACRLVARLGRRRRTTSWPAPSSPGTSSSAAARRRAATSPGSGEIPHPAQPLGFPLAEVAADGSSVITKHDGTGRHGHGRHRHRPAALRDPGHRLPQPRRDRRPDLDPAVRRRARPGGDHRRPRVRDPRAAQGRRQRAGRLPQLGRVRADRAGHQGEGGLGADQLGRRLRRRRATWTLGPLPAADADTEEGASTLLRCTVQDPSPEAVGRAFSSAAVELALASYPGFTMTAPPGHGTPFGVYRAEYVDRSGHAHRPPRRRPSRWSRRCRTVTNP